MTKRDFINQVLKSINQFKRITLRLRKILKKSKAIDFTHIDDFEESEIAEWETLPIDRLFFLFDHISYVQNFKENPTFDFGDTSVSLEFIDDYYYIYTKAANVDVTFEVSQNTVNNGDNIIDKVIPVLKRALYINDI